ncbi:hypothetical protein KL86PLE_100255 [uncultured Pleomorphomonas sp.]|uniref:Uncharacterized protein n=1 Tax=uncultured Pleomorphomonas sp. TaxID=442121 RepID=A0A212L2F9_9HYPH|nr:hypothetical protein [uncultured Pleomorphomonas sp.]SCM71539.1 hypothetical protein KL86PLE_100255 [uncultured Pleomorphomonas sp.]
MVDHIPDTSADVLEYGLSADKPYLYSLTVTEQVVRDFFSAIIKARDTVDSNPAADRGALLTAAGEALQSTLYGQNSAYLASPWNSERHLGRALVEQAGLGGSTSDAVLRCSYAMAKQLLDILNDADAGNLSDDNMKFRIDVMIEFWTYCFMGMKVPSGDEE